MSRWTMKGDGLGQGRGCALRRAPVQVGGKTHNLVLRGFSGKIHTPCTPPCLQAALERSSRHLAARNRCDSRRQFEGEDRASPGLFQGGRSGNFSTLNAEPLVISSPHLSTLERSSLPTATAALVSSTGLDIGHAEAADASACRLVTRQGRRSSPNVQPSAI